MPLPTFTPPLTPSPGLSDTPEVKIIKAQFGDGYTSSTADGINHMRRVVEATWDVVTTEDRDEILGFFEERAGHQPFYYAFPYDKAPSKWTVEQWSTTALSGGFHRVTATFRQSFTMAV